MKKRDLLSLVYQLAFPVGLMVLGVILFLSPDSASVLIARLMGWGLTAVGIGIGIAALVDRRGTVGKGVASVVCVLAGGALGANPLVLAAGIGRLLGILIAIRGIRDLFLARSNGCSHPLAVITALVGVILVVLPMTTSRLVFRLCGVVILVIGAAMLLDRLKHRRYLDSGDSNIIDAL